MKIIASLVFLVFKWKLIREAVWGETQVSDTTQFIMLSQ